MAERGGSHEQHQKAGQAGGEATAANHDREFYQEIGKKGGEARGDASRDEEGRFKRSDGSESDDSMEEGGSTRGGTREQHAEAGRQSHKNS